MPIVDVIIPVYNTKLAYVQAAVKSVQDQTVADWRVVLVNDGSAADYTAAFKAWLVDLNEPRVTYIESVNQGMPAARNLGIASSDAPFIAFLDSDDLWYPHKLQVQLDHIQAHPKVALLHASSDLLQGDDSSQVQKREPRPLKVNEQSLLDACVGMLKSNYVAVNTVMIRRSAGADIGFFDPKFRSVEDKEMWCRWLVNERQFHYQAQSLAIYRVHGNNISKNVQRMFDGRVQLVQRMDDLVQSRAPWLRAVWPSVRREMLQHAQLEAAQTHVLIGQYRQALAPALPWRSGWRSDSIKVLLKAMAGSLGLHR